jgi:hypothetical protein
MKEGKKKGKEKKGKRAIVKRGGKMAVKHTHREERERKSAIIPSSVVILDIFFFLSFFLPLFLCEFLGPSLLSFLRLAVHSSLPLSLHHRDLIVYWKRERERRDLLPSPPSFSCN